MNRLCCILLEHWQETVVLHVNSQKRITPITYSSNGAAAAKKVHKDDRQLYSPPSGKFSEKAGAFSEYCGVTLETVLFIVVFVSYRSVQLSFATLALCLWLCMELFPLGWTVSIW